jgi:hypothetical protein
VNAKDLEYEVAFALGMKDLKENPHRLTNEELESLQKILKAISGRFGVGINHELWGSYCILKRIEISDRQAREGVWTSLNITKVVNQDIDYYKKFARVAIKTIQSNPQPVTNEVRE